MRKFKTATKDSKAGYEMILSECSYNMAMYWLERELDKYNVVIRYTEKTNYPCNLTIIGTETKNVGAIMRTFYYDEERGYLLGEW